MSDLYRSQRAMRRILRAAMDRGAFAVLDIGTSKIACLILRVEGAAEAGEADEPGGRGRVRVVGAATTRSRGMRFGAIAAMAETERAIRTVVQAAQKTAGLRVDHAVACIAGADPCSCSLSGTVAALGEMVTDRDVARVLAACDTPDLGAEREVLHAQPINFSLDGRAGLKDPRGQSGRRLSTDMHLVSVDARAVRDLLHCIKRADLEVAGLTSSAYAAGLASLVADERELGAACIEMGGGATGISIFLKKQLIHTESIAMGGDHVTADIAKGLRIPVATAERLKTFHGGVLATGVDDRDMIETAAETGDWEHDRRAVSRAELIGIMRPRVDEILEIAAERLAAAGFDALPAPQIVLTGGGSQVPGLDGLAARIFGQQVRFGRPVRVAGLPQAASGPAFSAAVGLSLSAADPRDGWWDVAVPESAGAASPLKSAMRWFRENW